MHLLSKQSKKEVPPSTIEAALKVLNIATPKKQDIKTNLTEKVFLKKLHLLQNYK